jgi:hypothetical protein
MTQPIAIDAKDLVDGAALRSIAALADPVGVLSVYTTANPREGSTTRPAWQVRIANDFVALERRLRKDDDTSRADLLALRLADVDRELRALVDASTPGQGRALFLALDAGTITTVAVQVPLGDHVDLGRRAHVRPLLAALCAFPPAGVAAVSGHGVHLVDIRLGYACDVGSDDYEPADSGRHEHTGPAAANPALAQHGTAQHDLYARREADRLARFLRAAGGRVADRAVELGWEYLVVTGDPERTAAFEAGLPHEPALPAVTVAHRVAGLSPAKVHAVVAADLADLRHRCARDLARRARDLALGGGAGAYGLADSLTALAEGAVLNLVLDASGEWAGRVGPDGRLYPDLVSVPGVAEEALAVEPRLGERMVEAALRHGGRVTLLDPADAVDLRDAGGVAAILRW